MIAGQSRNHRAPAGQQERLSWRLARVCGRSTGASGTCPGIDPFSLDVLKADLVRAAGKPDMWRGMKTRKKSDLPTKTCKACGRPFAWRRKWAKVWEEVRYCSDRCRRGR